MQTRLTLRLRGGRTHDVEVNAPLGTSLGVVASLLRTAIGSGSDLGGLGFWSGSRALLDHEHFGGPGLRSGCVIGVGGPAPRSARPPGAIHLQVVGGPDAGRVEPVSRGRLRIGRDPGCEVRLTDPDVSRHHAELRIAATGITVRDLGSTNGTRILSATSTPTAVAATSQNLPLGAYVTLGNTTLCIAGVGTPPASLTPGGDGRLLVNRSPRLEARPPGRVDLPPLSPPHEHSSLPWIPLLVPALAGVGLAWSLHSPQFLAFALLSPVILLVINLGDRIDVGRRRRRSRVSTRTRLTAATNAANALSEAEVAHRRRSHPDPAAVLTTAITPDARIWERGRDDDDFLDVRLGLGTYPAHTLIHRGEEALPPTVLNAVPAAVSLRDGPIGICGPRSLSLPLARWVLGQLVTLHSPADLRIVALLPDDADREWEWLRWLPHLRDNDASAPRIACTSGDRKPLLADLNARLEGANLAPSHRSRPAQPWTVVLVDRGVTDLGNLSGLLTRGSGASITAVFVADDARRLPPSCQQTARLAGETGSHVIIRSRLGTPSGDGTAPATRSGARASVTDSPQPDALPIADQVTPQWCEQVARGLAPLHDPGAEHHTGLPSDIRARDLFGLEDLSTGAIRERWARAAGRAFTPIAAGPDGAIELDLGRDGPHLLIAGTTGAGKSELLQTLVAGLAVHAGPQDVQFVLIDYKGGAAFGACARLPHTAGLVTDLDGQSTQRALQSLDAELRRRETLFAAAGVAELAAYQRRRSPIEPAEPLGRLVLVVDEFAALAEELPEFVSGLVGIAQRGRSLGVHLILATQRPGGVVSPEIRANTALRIALRVTDAAESTDVIGSDLAALIDRHLPGRAVLRSGQTLIQMQVARVSIPVANDGPDIDVVVLDRWGRRPPRPKGPHVGQVTDLDAIVAALADAADADARRTPRRPWLDPLPVMLMLAALLAYETNSAIALGLTDRPLEQSQTPFLLDFADAQTMVFTGGPRSGRTSVLCAAGVSGARRLAVDDLHIYAIDCAGGGLRTLAELPHCGAVIGRDAPTSIGALVLRLSRELSRRQEEASIEASHRRAGPRSIATDPIGAPAARPFVDRPALLLLLDGWEGFLAAVEEVDAGRTVDTFLHLLRDGPGSGLTILVTGDRATLTARLSSAVQHRFALRMSDPADYAITGLKRSQIPTTMPTGRMIDTADGTQTQLGMFDNSTNTDPARSTQLAQVVDLCRARDAVNPARRRPFRVRALPHRIRMGDLRPHPGPGHVVIGVGGDAGAAVTLDLSVGRTIGTDVRFLIAGPPRSGRSTLLCLILGQLTEHGRDVLVAAGPRSPLAVAAGARAMPVVDPAGIDEGDGLIVDKLLETGRPLCLLVDDGELFAETLVGERLSTLVRRSPPGLDVFVTGRTDDLAMAFRGVAADVKRARIGLLLQPGPGDGELFGVHLPYQRATLPVGRGLLIAAELLPGEHWAEELGRGPIAIQVAQP